MSVIEKRRRIVSEMANANSFLFPTSKPSVSMIESPKHVEMQMCFAMWMVVMLSVIRCDFWISFLTRMKMSKERA